MLMTSYVGNDLIQLVGTCLLVQQSKTNIYKEKLETAPRLWKLNYESYYSRTSMARTSLGPWKCVRDMGSSSHWGLIVVPSQEASGDNLGIFFFDFLQNNCMLSLLIRIASMRRF